MADCLTSFAFSSSETDLGNKIDSKISIIVPKKSLELTDITDVGLRKKIE